MGREPTVTRALRAAAWVVVAVYLVALLFGPRGAHLWRELVLQVGALFAIAGYVASLVVTQREHRGWRTPMVAWISFLALGNVLTNAHTGSVQPEWSVVPSLVVYVLCYPTQFVAMAVLLRSTVRQARPAAVIDAAIAGLAVAGALMAFVVPAVVAAATKGGLPPALALAFPISDALQLCLWVAGMALVGPGRISPWFVLATSLFASADTVFIVETAQGTWQTGTPADGIWVIASAIAGLLGSRSPRDAAQSRTWQAAAISVPFLTGMTALVTLVVGTRHPLPTAGVVLASTAILAVQARLVLAHAQERRGAVAHTLARTDELTGLANRRGLYEALGTCVARVEDTPVALLLGDLDRFKQVNDTLGHDVGDDLLRLVAARLTAVMPSGAVLGRLGGDEFAVVLPVSGSTHPAIAGEVTARAMVEALEAPFPLGAASADIGVSVGVSWLVGDPDRTTPPEASELLRRADRAMYEAKRSRTGVATDPPLRRASDRSAVGQQAGPAEDRLRR